MSRHSERGGVLVKILLVLLGLAGLGAAGFGLWWLATAGDRALYAYEYSPREEDIAWMAGHPADPRVQAAVGKKFLHLAEWRGVSKSPPTSEMLMMDKVFSLHYPPEDRFVSLAIRYSLRTQFPRARAWIKLPDTDPLVKASYTAELSDVALYAYGWNSTTEALEGHVADLVALLEKLGLSTDDPSVRNAAAGVWIRFDFPPIRPWVKKIEEKKELGEAVAAFTVEVSKTSTSPTKEWGERLMREIARLKPEPTADLVLALGRYGSIPDAVLPFKAWGKEAVEGLLKARESMSSDSERENATILLTKLGAAKLTGSDILRKIGTLRSFEEGQGYRYQPPEDAALGIPYFSLREYGSRLESSIPWTVKQIVDMGPGAVPAMAEAFASYPDDLEVHVLCQAFVKASPEALAEALAKTLEEFEPVVREVLAKERKPKAMDFLVPRQWRKMTPAIREALSQLCALEDPPDAVVACLWRAVSCLESTFSGMAGTKLREKLPADRFVRGLFLHLNQKAQYDLAEVKNLVSMLTQKEGSGPHVTAMMASLLDAMSKPEAVPMIQKVVGLQALAKVGDATSRPILERYAADTSSYVDITFKVDSKGNRSDKTSTTRKFADLAKTALDAIR